MVSVMPVMAKERAVFYREQAAGMYHVAAYAVSYGVAELPYIVVTTGLFVNVYYFQVGLSTDPVDKFWDYWLFFALYVSCTVRHHA
jgi:ABC-type multidrug transport system permease subunit